MDKLLGLIKDKLVSRKLAAALASAVAALGVAFGWWSAEVSADLAASLGAAIVAIYIAVQGFVDATKEKGDAIAKIEAAKAAVKDPSAG